MSDQEQASIDQHQRALLIESKIMFGAAALGAILLYFAP